MREERYQVRCEEKSVEELGEGNGEDSRIRGSDSPDREVWVIDWWRDGCMGLLKGRGMGRT